jgi:AraC-like DNA-binding protein
MDTLILLMSAGCAASVFTAVALMVAPNPAGNGRRWLSLVCVQASLLFLKDIVEKTGGPRTLTTFLIFVNFLFGLPALYLFMRASYGEPARNPFLHFIPALANLPAALIIAQREIGSAGVDSAVPAGSGAQVIFPVVFINVLAFGETLQLIHYAGASLRYLRRKVQRERERTYRRVILAVAGCYGLYYAIRWIGLSVRLSSARNGGFPPLASWVNPVSMVFVALFAGSAGVYIVTRPEILGSGKTRMGRGLRPRSDHADSKAISDRAERLLASSIDLSGESITPRRLASRLGIPYYLLSRAVNESGRTIADLIREKRVEKAKALMNDFPDATLLRIALEAGFSAKSSFNAAFKKTVGVSPSEYRRRGQTELR